MPPPTAKELVYFLHIPKTSGSSLREFFIRARGDDRVTPVLVWDNLSGGEYQLDERIEVIVGHFGGLLPLWLKRWPRIITVLREPVARALSHINHVQRDPNHLLHAMAAGLTVAQYCEHPALRRTVENFQARYVATLSFASALVRQGAPGNAQPFGRAAVDFENALYSLDRQAGLLSGAVEALESLDAVGLCEAQAQSAQLFARILGWIGIEDVPEIRANVGVAGKSLESLSDEDVAALRRLNEVDLELYALARRMFSAACRKHGIMLQSDYAR